MANTAYSLEREKKQNGWGEGPLSWKRGHKNSKKNPSLVRDRGETEGEKQEPIGDVEIVKKEKFSASAGLGGC